MQRGRGNPNQSIIEQQPMTLLTCPSSPLPQFLDPGAPDATLSLSPTYTGIAGSDVSESIQPVNDNYPDNIGGFTSTGGVKASSGMLVDVDPVNLREVTDGLSNTLAVGEQSGWLRTNIGGTIDGRSDAYHGFSAGSTALSDRVWNFTTVRYPIGYQKYESSGIAGNTGPNRPIQSVHAGGAMVMMADGSVHFTTTSLDLKVLKSLSDRDDGETVTLYP